MTTSSDEALALRKERWYVIILAAIQVVHILDFVIMMPLGPRFMRVFNISPVEFSTLVSAYTFSAGIVGFLGALYADHFDRKKFLLFNFTGFIFGTFMCAIAPNFAALLIARIIAGAFGGILNANVLSLISDLIPFQRRGAAMGVVMSAFSISSIVGIPIGLYIANHFDWHGRFGRAQLQSHRLLTPNFFQVVVLANRRLHDVHHHRAAIDNDPFTVFFPLDARLAKTSVAYFVTNSGGQGFGLAVRGATGNDDPFKQGRQMLGVEGLDVLSLDVFQTVNHHALQFLNVFFLRGFGHVGPCINGFVECIESLQGSAHRLKTGLWHNAIGYRWHSGESRASADAHSA